MAGWAHTYELLREEFIQREDEGCVIPTTLRQRFAELHPEHDAWNEVLIDPIYNDLMALPADPVLAAAEPDDLEAIRRLRPTAPALPAAPLDQVVLLDRLHGAWTGRCVGCALGKPVEGTGMVRRHGRNDGRAEIRNYLKHRDDWPLRDYISIRDVGDGMKVWECASVREKIAYMEPDDDIHYSLVGLGVIEEHGPEFTWQQVAYYWLAHIPVAHICTAETQAIQNWQNRSNRRQGSATAAYTRMHRNPYREWIGAQIRADGWAWVCAGKPELAAEFAHRDASWTHTRNGIYGEMLFAAIQAAAFVESDPRRLVEIGLGQIPAQCRLAKAVRAALAWCDAGLDYETCLDRLDTAFGTMSPVHTINNAAICVLALLHGGRDCERAICLSVMAGLDTDCNGATVGNILGALHGRAAFGGTMAARLNDTIRPAMVGFQEVTMTALAQRTLVQWRRVDEWARQRAGA